MWHMGDPQDFWQIYISKNVASLDKKGQREYKIKKMILDLYSTGRKQIDKTT